MASSRCPECRGRLSIVDCDTHGPVWVCEQCVWAGSELPDTQESDYYARKRSGRLSAAEVAAGACATLLFVVVVTVILLALTK